MLIVPLKNDTITTSDGNDFIVLKYTNLKLEPAVYIDVKIGENNLVYFHDITKINGVQVEFVKSSKVFNALGVVKRKYNLPQPDDKVIVQKPTKPIDSTEDTVTVQKLKLHNKAIGISKGLMFCEKHECFTLPDIIKIERAVGSDIKFDTDKFLKYYKDYLPFNYK